VRWSKAKERIGSPENNLNYLYLQQRIKNHGYYSRSFEGSFKAPGSVEGVSLTLMEN
jgi:hypothetical protein